MNTLLKPIGLEELSQRILALPTNLRTFYVSESTTGVLETIQAKHSLDDIQMNLVARVTSRILLGILPIKEFVASLSEALGMDKEKVRQIAQDINEQIFQPVREELLLVHGINQKHEAGIKNYEEEEKANAVNVTRDKVHEEAPESSTEQNMENKAQIPKQQDESSQKREELLARLRAAQNAPIAPPILAEPLLNQEPPQEPEPPKPVTAAWNGKTIDLSKIPPRRQLNGNGKKNGEEEIRTVQLKKGPDGYWYEV